MKKFIFFLFLSCMSAVFSYEVISHEEEGFILERDVAVTVRDGTTLYGNVFRPLSEGRYPVILTVGPYGKDRLPVKYKKDDGHIQVSDYAALEVPDPVYWVSHGYVVVNVDSRGSWDSGGNLSLLSTQENEDYYDVIEWAGKAPWSNGRVATSGASYYAMTQWRVASMRPPHLKAIIPWEGLTDVYRDIVYHGGIEEKVFFKTWFKRVRMARRWGSKPEDLLKGLERNPLYNSFYKRKNPDLSRIDIPAFVVASWSNHGIHSRGTIEGYKGISSRDKWLYIHGRKTRESYYSQEGLAEQKRFLDYFLKGIDNGMKGVPRVRYSVRKGYQEERYSSADAYPLKDAQRKRLYLDNSENLLSEGEVEGVSTDYVSRKKVFNYTFQRDSDLVGGMTLMTYVAAENSDDADIFVGIKKLNSRGEEVFFEGVQTSKGHVASGWLRVSHRKVDWDMIDQDRVYLSHDEIQKVHPGEIVQIYVEILPSGTEFKRGETLSLIISDRDLKSAGNLKHNNINKGRTKIYTGAAYQSYLEIPIVR